MQMTGLLPVMAQNSVSQAIPEVQWARQELSQEATRETGF